MQSLDSLMRLYAVKNFKEPKEWDPQSFTHRNVLKFYFRDKTVCLKKLG